MSFCDNVKKFTQPYADDEYDDYDDDEYIDDYEEPVEQPTRRAPRRTPAPAPAPAPVEDEFEDDAFGFTPAPAAASTAPATGFNGRIVGSSNKNAIVLFRPTSFNDTSKAADELNAHKAVVVNMENVDKAMARRVVDFLSGCVYSLGGTVKKIAQSAYLFCPRNVEVHGDLESIQAEVESYI
jgi:cell division inhibitor SepF